MSADPQRPENAPRRKRCVVHDLPMIDPPCPDGTERCSFYLPDLGASEDYGCMTREDLFREETRRARH